MRRYISYFTTTLVGIMTFGLAGYGQPTQNTNNGDKPQASTTTPPTASSHVASSKPTVQALNRNEVGAVLGDKGVLTYFVNKLPNNKFAISDKGYYFGRYYPMTIALKNGDEELTKSINQGIEAIVKDGTYSKIYEKWFNAKPAIMPKHEPISTDNDGFISTTQ